jgi:hypothetical protein
MSFKFKYRINFEFLFENNTEYKSPMWILFINKTISKQSQASVPLHMQPSDETTPSRPENWANIQAGIWGYIAGFYLLTYVCVLPCLSGRLPSPLAKEKHKNQQRRNTYLLCIPGLYFLPWQIIYMRETRRDILHSYTGPSRKQKEYLRIIR